MKSKKHDTLTSLRRQLREERRKTRNVKSLCSENAVDFDDSYPGGMNGHVVISDLFWALQPLETVKPRESQKRGS